MLETFFLTFILMMSSMNVAASLLPSLMHYLEEIESEKANFSSNEEMFQDFSTSLLRNVYFDLPDCV